MSEIYHPNDNSGTRTTVFSIDTSTMSVGGMPSDSCRRDGHSRHNGEIRHVTHAVQAMTSAPAVRMRRRRVRVVENLRSKLHNMIPVSPHGLLSIQPGFEQISRVD